MTVTKIIFSFWILLFTISCKKDKVPISQQEFVCAPCEELPPLGEYTYGYEYNYENYITSPEFNPNNENEFIYIEQSEKIWKFNILTKEKTLLFSDGQLLYAGLTWSKKDWIIFHKGLNGLYRMKENGDSLTPIQFSEPIFHPKWNWEGTKFVVYRGFSNGQKYSLVFNDQYQVIDTLMDKTQIVSWNHPRYAANEEITKIQMLNVENKQVEREITSTYQNTLGAFAWGNGSNILYSNADGMFLHDLESNIRHKLRCRCNSFTYSFSTTNRSRTKIIFNKWKHTPVSPGSTYLNTRTSFALMDIDGSNEVEIEIPE